MALKYRIEKLEKQAGGGKMNSPVIRYIRDQKDGEKEVKAARKKAVAEWEAINGSLNGREPRFIERSIISPPPKIERVIVGPKDRDPEGL